MSRIGICDRRGLWTRRTNSESWKRIPSPKAACSQPAVAELPTDNCSAHILGHCRCDQSNDQMKDGGPYRHRTPQSSRASGRRRRCRDRRNRPNYEYLDCDTAVSWSTKRSTRAPTWTFDAWCGIHRRHEKMLPAGGSRSFEKPLFSMNCLQRHVSRRTDIRSATDGGRHGRVRHILRPSTAQIRAQPNRPAGAIAQGRRWSTRVSKSGGGSNSPRSDQSGERTAPHIAGRVYFLNGICQAGI